MRNFHICEKKKRRRFSNITPPVLVDTLRSLPRNEREKRIHEGLITELPNGIFWIRLDNENLILGYVSETIRRSFFIRIRRGNRGKSEVGRYDSTSGRIIYRLRKKIPMIRWFFRFQHSFWGYTIRNSKFQETYFLPIIRI